MIELSFPKFNQFGLVLLYKKVDDCPLGKSSLNSNTYLF
ncbi:hypothetical protein HMPREF9968_1460 [Streptococcus oralis SK255]|uniref:Uncharacterized protein n=1 Tax=Streptococcus oralis SK255 TaxID=1005704 RepID=F5VTI5_STROR|nr:hypothetical protein HMPREF9968_1460 [Streptococcus oralis SK255]